MKLLLYCTKSQKNDRLCRENDWQVLSGSVVASCECYWVEEIFKDTYDWDWGSGDELRTNTYDSEDLADHACLDYEELEKYLKVIKYDEYHIKSYQKGYALILEENVTVFDRPKELSDYGLKKAPQNMMYVYDENGEKCVLISIRPEYLLKIISGEKTIEIRKRIVSELKKLIE